MTRRSNAVTIYDVAKQAGVSVATVSRYINRNAPVSTEVAERLDRVMAELKYLPHAAARHLASRKTGLIGLLLTNMHNDFFAPLVSGIEQMAGQHGYNLLVATYHSDSRGSVPPPLGTHNTDGLLVFADSLTDEDLARLHEGGFPIVLIHRTPPASLPLPSVTVENKSATHRLVEHLILQHNKKRILFLRGPIHQEDSYWRETGYRSALEAHGIEFDEGLVLVGDFEREIAYNALNQFLANGNRDAFDAVFAGDDDAAIGVINALKEHGYRIPEDVAVVGFDDLQISAFLSPPLTTVRAPTETVGRIAAERLLGLLNNDISYGTTLLPTEIIIRRSCGCDL
ncbi:MAG TPA: LacI family DNA-binding transcriptional regulator [Anaerolineales bacterium]|nr:LacI family DNA-binding transcriptional regulator [Anaerolineales bacterium]